MKYREFCEKLKERVLENKEWNIQEENYKFYPDGFKGETKKEIEFVHETNVKYNYLLSDILKGDFITITIDYNTTGCVARFEAVRLYEEYENEGWERVDYILNENIKRMKDESNYSILNDFENYDAIKHHLMIRPLNYERNKMSLKDVIYRKYADMAFVVYVVVNDCPPDFYTTKVKKEWLEKWNVTEDQVYEDAFARTQSFLEPKLFPETIVNYNSRFVNPFDSEILKVNKYDIPTLTNSRNLNGATVMFYPGMAKRIYELMGEEYYVAFTSINEARIHACSVLDLSRIQKSLDGLNYEYNNDDEILSELVYRYNPKTDALEVASTK